MLHVVHSNRMERLADRLADLLAAPASDDPFVPEHVVVESPGMSRWLALQVADRLGVTANVRFDKPLKFLYEVAYRGVLGRDAVPANSSFRRDVLVWRILRLLPAVETEPGFEPLARYLSATGTRERHQLATRIADAFDRLTIWRPDWIQAWERGESRLDDDAHERWQAELWRRLCADVRVRDTALDHRAAVQARFREALAQDAAGAARAVPPRVVIVGGTSIPRESFRDFVLLSKTTDVHVLFLNPCELEWTEIRSGARIARDAARLGADPDDLHLFEGHPLLASWGRDGQAFLADLIDAEDQAGVVAGVDSEKFVDPRELAREAGRSPTLLETVQSDLLRLEPTPPAKMPRERPSPRVRRDDDPPPRSIQVHACHSPMRELEVLQDRLLELLEHDSLHPPTDGGPPLGPSDVLVLCPDIDAYAPYVDAVFGTAPPRRHIPYTIADRDDPAARPTVDAFLRILDLPVGRFEAGPLLDLLDVPAVRRRFGLGEAEVEVARAFAHDTGIRWGVDAAWRGERGAPAFEGHAWRDGLDRLMQAYAFGVACRGPGPESLEGDAARTMGRFRAFASELVEADRRLAGRRSVEAWIELLRDLLDRLVEPEGSDEEHDRLGLGEVLDGLREDAAEAGHVDPVDLEVVRAEFRARLTPRGAGRFLAGGVVFGTTTPMRSVPFAVVALVGMNDDAFPRRDQAPDFDLLDRRPRRGDPALRESDRYLFLETLLSARRHLLVTYVGRGVRDDRRIPPSVLVDELLDVLNGPPPTRDVDDRSRAGDVLAPTDHPLQSFATRYGAAEGDPTAADLFTYRPAPAPDPRDEPGPLVVDDLPVPGGVPSAVEVDDLVAFVGHPSRWFVRERLRLDVHDSDPAPEPREPFVLGFLDRYRVEQAMVETALDGGDPEHVEIAARSTGAIPPGAPGAVVLEAERVAVETFVERVRGAAGEGDGETVEIDQDLGVVRLTGRVDRVYAGGPVAGRPAKLKAKDRAEAWVRHLAVCAERGDRQVLRTRVVARDTTVTYDAVEPDRARVLLTDLVGLYHDAHRRPVPLYPAAAHAYVESIGNARKRSPPMHYARVAFEDGDHPERNDVHVAALLRGTDPLGKEFEALAVRVFGPLVECEAEGDR